MIRTVRGLRGCIREDEEREEERRVLMEGLAQTKVLIAQAYACFNTVCDPDLIESYVFEINALQSRYSYLLRRVKELDGVPARLEAGCTIS